MHILYTYTSDTHGRAPSFSFQARVPAPAPESLRLRIPTIITITTIVTIIIDNTIDVITIITIAHPRIGIFTLYSKVYNAIHLRVLNCYY